MKTVGNFRSISLFRLSSARVHSRQSPRSSRSRQSAYGNVESDNPLAGSARWGLRETGSASRFRKCREGDSPWAAIAWIAREMGCAPDTARRWIQPMRACERDTGQRADRTTALTANEREGMTEPVREQEPANEVLSKASEDSLEAEIGRAIQTRRSVQEYG